MIIVPRDTIWLEAFFKRFPFDYLSLRSQLLARGIFLATI